VDYGAESQHEERRTKKRNTAVGLKKRSEGAPVEKAASGVLKRRYGLTRCRYRGKEWMKRWVRFGGMADTLISIANVLAART
jgi:hypothetical protein